MLVIAKTTKVASVIFYHFNVIFTLKWPCGRGKTRYKKVGRNAVVRKRLHNSMAKTVLFNLYLIN